jgi:hypothetical protein
MGHLLWCELAREDQSSRKEICLSDALPTANPTWVVLGLNRGVCSATPATDPLRRGTTHEWKIFLAQLGKFCVKSSRHCEHSSWHCTENCIVTDVCPAHYQCPPLSRQKFRNAQQRCLNNTSGSFIRPQSHSIRIFSEIWECYIFWDITSRKGKVKFITGLN